jgi:hypothetical protein
VDREEKDVEVVMLKAVAFVAGLAVAGVRPVGAQTPPVPLGETPPAWSNAVATADRAMAELQGALLARLKEEMSRGGPAAAMRVCHEEALHIAARIARERGVELGRTSHRVRNAANAPRDWQKATVAAGAGKASLRVSALAFDLGDRIGVMKPIGTIDLCLRCHGAPESLQPEVQDALKAFYPQDRATGFAPGELRGWMWVEAPKLP